jgi:sarcosine oxidase delta subunit
MFHIWCYLLIFVVKRFICFKLVFSETDPAFQELRKYVAYIEENENGYVQRWWGRQATCTTSLSACIESVSFQILSSDFESGNFGAQITKPSSTCIPLLDAGY